MGLCKLAFLNDDDKQSLTLLLQDGEEDDIDPDDDEPRADVEGRVEKYIGVKVKVCISFNFIFCSL